MKIHEDGSQKSFATVGCVKLFLILTSVQKYKNDKVYLKENRETYKNKSSLKKGTKDGYIYVP
jgi:hypothetical protein